MGSKEIADQMVESPWEADDLLEPLSKAEKAAVRTELLARATKKPERYLLEAVGAFPDAEIVALLEKLLANKKAHEQIHEGAVEGLATMETAAAKKVLAGLLDHPTDKVAKIAIESLDEKAAVKALVPRLDAIAERGDDLLMLAAVEKLVEAAPTNKDVIAALAKHWDFAIKHDGTLMAANAIYDALIEHAPTSDVAQAAFQAALASGTEYGIVRGRCALALTGQDTATHVKELKKMKGLKASSSSFRSAALKKLGKK